MLIMEFLELKKSWQLIRKARHLFYALWIPIYLQTSSQKGMDLMSYSMSGLVIVMDSLNNLY